MVGPQGLAIGVEHIPELASSSIENIQKSAAAPLLKDGSLSVHVGGMISGFPVYLKYWNSSNFSNTNIQFLPLWLAMSP